jgi:hypothetical protein
MTSLNPGAPGQRGLIRTPHASEGPIRTRITARRDGERHFPPGSTHFLVEDP